MGSEMTPARPCGGFGLTTWSLDAPYDADAAFGVLERVAFGHSLREIEADRGRNHPPAQLFLIWVMRNPDLAMAFTRAREVSAYSFEDEVIYLLRELMKNENATANDIRKAGLLADHLRKSAALRNPSVFSEKSAVQVTVPIQINTTLDMGGASASGGTKEFPNIYELKADNIVEVDKEAVVEPETAEHMRALRAAGASGERRVPKGYRARSGKRLLVPKARGAETELERELRIKAEKRVRDMREMRKEQQRKRMQRLRDKKRGAGEAGDGNGSTQD